MPRLHTWVIAALGTGVTALGVNHLVNGPQTTAYEEHRRIVEARKFIVTALHRRLELLDRCKPIRSDERIAFFVEAEELVRESVTIDSVNYGLIRDRCGQLKRERCKRLRGRDTDLTDWQRVKSFVAYATFWLFFRCIDAVFAARILPAALKDRLWSPRLRTACLTRVAAFVLAVLLEADTQLESVHVFSDGYLSSEDAVLFVGFATHWLEELAMWNRCAPLVLGRPRTAFFVASPEHALPRAGEIRASSPAASSARQQSSTLDGASPSAGGEPSALSVPWPKGAKGVRDDDAIARALLSPHDGSGGGMRSIDRITEDASVQAEEAQKAVHTTGHLFYPWCDSVRGIEREVARRSLEWEADRTSGPNGSDAMTVGGDRANNSNSVAVAAHRSAATGDVDGATTTRVVALFAVGAERFVRLDKDRAAEAALAERARAELADRERLGAQQPSSNTIEGGGFDIPADVAARRQRHRGTLIERGRLERERKAEAERKAAKDAVTGPRQEYFDELRQNASARPLSNDSASLAEGAEQKLAEAVPQPTLATAIPAAANVPTNAPTSGVDRWGNVYGGVAHGGLRGRRVVRVVAAEPALASDVWHAMARRVKEVCDEMAAEALRSAPKLVAPIVTLSDPVVSMKDALADER